MLVFKRAVCFVLATLLVFPTSALARANNGANTPKRAVAKKAAPRKLASMPSANAARGNKPAPKYMTSGEALSSVMPKRMSGKGAGFEVLEQKGKGKFLKSRLVKKGDYSELLVDNDEDGTADVWEVTRGSMTMKATRPYLGRFTRIQYTDRRAKAEIKTTLQLKSDFSNYRVVSTNIVPYKLMNSGGVRADLCETSESEFTKFEKILADLLKETPGTRADGLQCKINRYQDFLFDPSCRATPAMEASLEPMIRGLSDLTSSRGSAPPRLLQCLENHGYGYHAAKIQDTLASHLNAPRWKLKKYAGWADAQYNDNSCERLAGSAPVYANGLATGVNDAQSFTESRKPLFTCSPTTDRDERQGSWDPDSKNVILRKSAAQMTRPGVSSQDAYASLMFHELIHSTGISSDEEELVENMQACCSVTGASASGVQAACGAIRKRHEDEQLVTRVTMAMGFEDVQSELKNLFGQTNSEVFTDRWIGGLRTDPVASAAISEYETCETRTPGQASCRATLIEKLNRYSDSFVTRECPAFKSSSRDPSRVSCADIQARFGVMLNSPREVLSAMPVIELETIELVQMPTVVVENLTTVLPQVNVLPACSDRVDQRLLRALTSVVRTPTCTPNAPRAITNLADSRVRQDATRLEAEAAARVAAEDVDQAQARADAERSEGMSSSQRVTSDQARARAEAEALARTQPPRPNITTATLDVPPLTPTAPVSRIENGGALPPAAPNPATRAPIIVQVPPTARVPVATAPNTHAQQNVPSTTVQNAPATNAPAPQPAATETGGSLVFGGPIAQPQTSRPTLGTSAPVATAPTQRPVTVYQQPPTTRDSNASAGTINRSNPNTYQPPVQPSVNPYTSPRPMPVAGSSAPIGEGDRSLSAATPVTNALLNIGEGISNQVIGALSVPTANASVISARAMVALPERNLASYQPPASSGGSRAGASPSRGGNSGGGSSNARRGDGPSSSGSASAGRSSLAGSSGSGTSDRAAGEDSQDDPANAAAGEPRVASAERAPAERDENERPVAANARTANARGWNQNTFRSTTDARIFLTRTSVTEVESLMRQPAFVDDLVRRRIGIRRNNGRFVGHSQPEIVYVECGSKLVLRGLCR